MAGKKLGHQHGHGPAKVEVGEIAQSINQEVVQTLTQSNAIQGLALNIDASGKSKVDLKHTEVSVKIFADQTNKADQSSEQTANNAVTVETTVVSGKGANATVSTVSQTIDQNVEQVLNQANSITGMDINITASDKSHVKIMHSDFNVVVVADQTNEANQNSTQTAGNNVLAAGGAFRWNDVSVDDVTQAIDQSSSQSINQSNTINGIILTVDAEDKSHVNMHHNDFGVLIFADQSNDGSQSVTQTASNDFAFG
jgi:hypothetical protein